MSLYNMINGVNMATFHILPMLGEKHADQYPRFRDCFITEQNEILVYTRVGGNNRNCGYGEEELLNHPNFLRTYDDRNDSTYGYYVFSVPSEWKADYDLITTGLIKGVSEEYKERLYKVYPKLKEQWDEIFK
ncbi:MAG: hypothetical protein ACRCX2_10245 [Paraclostridium sp.]